MGIVEKKEIGIRNNDGAVYKVKTDDGRHWLVIESDKGHYSDEIFHGMGPTDETEICEQTYSLL